MTPHTAAQWLRQFVFWGQPQLSPLARYEADMFGAHLELGEWGKVLQMARRHGYFDRRLCIFVRRLVRIVDGYKRPACSWCCDTGTLPQREGPPSYCDCSAGAALIAERDRPRTPAELRRDRQNLAASLGMTTAAERSMRWKQRRR